MKNSKEISQTRLTTKQVSQITRLKANTLHYYIQSGGVVPDVDEGSGRGTKRLFSITNLIEVIIIESLIESGLAKQRILEAMKSIRDSGDREKISFKTISHPFAGFIVFRLNQDKKMGHSFIGYQDPDIAKKFLSVGTCSIVINLNHIMADVYGVLSGNNFG